ncbi:MAG: acyltransferase [Candidatus Daviesbacteria bacterium]|nr:acyltransferase [Candidatus Daviesbacteria bacterium]
MKLPIEKNANEKILYLEGLRGVAMSVVVLNHFAAIFYPAIIFGEQAYSHNNLELIIYKTPLNIFFSGIFAISIFFLLSGYFLSYKYFRFHNEEPLIPSMIKRYLRLAIPTLISVLIAFLLLKNNLFHNLSTSSITGSSMWFANFWNFNADLYNVIIEGVFMTSIFIGNLTYNPVLWMMGYELAGSFLIYIALWIFQHTKKKILVYFLLFLFTFAWKSYLMGFVLGMLICDLEYRSKVNIFIYKNKILGIIFLVMAIILGSFPIGSTQDTIFDFIKIPLLSDSRNIILFQTIAASFIFLAIKNLRILKMILEFSILRFLGEISFSVFFLHLIIFGSFSSLIFEILSNYLSYNISVLIVFIISFPLILVAAFYFNKFIVLKSLKFANFAKRLINQK